jgi:hypothetical protein
MSVKRVWFIAEQKVADLQEQIAAFRDLSTSLPSTSSSARGSWR